jgi:hypothetical protein
MPWSIRRTKSEQQRAKEQKEQEKKDQLRLKEVVAAHPSARFPPTQIAYTDPSFAEPPTLNYSLYPRIRYILFFWTLVFIDVICVPLVLYFTLWYKTNLSPNAGTSATMLMTKD